MFKFLASLTGMFILWVAGLLTGVITGLIVAPAIAGDTSEAVPTPVTVTQTSVMMEGGGTAVGSLPDGTEVLLRGDWIAGQEVPAFKDKETSTRVEDQHIYSTSNPIGEEQTGYVWLFASLGVMVGSITAATLMLLNDRRERRERESRRLVHAAVE